MTDLERAISDLKAQIADAQKQFAEKYSEYENDKKHLSELEAEINHKIDALVDEAIAQQQEQLTLLKSMKKEITGSSTTGTKRPYVRKEKMAEKIEEEITKIISEVTDNPSFVPLPNDTKKDKILSFVKNEVGVRLPGTRNKTKTAITEIISKHVFDQLKIAS